MRKMFIQSVRRAAQKKFKKREYKQYSQYQLEYSSYFH